MIQFTTEAWEHYLYWQQTDKAVLKKINQLIKECLRHPYEGIGKPEPLRQNLSGFWSRRITGEQRLGYRVENGILYIISCFHAGFIMMNRNVSRPYQDELLKALMNPVEAAAYLNATLMKAQANSSLSRYKTLPTHIPCKRLCHLHSIYLVYQNF